MRDNLPHSIASNSHSKLVVLNCRMLLHRHFQWLTTSSTLVYCVSRMSDYSQAQVARLVGLQGSLIITGTAATLMTSWFKCKPTIWLANSALQDLTFSGDLAYLSIRKKILAKASCKATVQAQLCHSIWQLLRQDNQASMCCGHKASLQSCYG